MYAIDKIIEYLWSKEFQNRGAEYINVPKHIVDAPKIDKYDESEVVEFIDKHIIHFLYILPDKTKYLELSNLVKKVQTNHIITCRERETWNSLERERL